ncbi:MAG: Bug family tripartite tricarboxylate transporter substrate binding protein [Burkholderiales bacterium]
MTIKHTATIVLLAAAATCTSAGAADEYPNKPIRIIVPYAPGGGTDAVTRIIGQKLNERFGQTIVVDNRPGAASMIGTEITAKSAPDGYTLILSDTPHTINPSILRKVPFDPIKDFTPIALVASSPLMLVVHPAVPAQTLKAFIELAKAQPGKIVLASGGTGATTHIVGELFKLRAGVDLVHVPYKGTGPALADVLAGQIQSTFTTTPGAMPQVKAGKLRALAVSTKKRSIGAPDVPTFEELGVKDFEAANWYGFQAPAGLPAPVLKVLSTEMIRAATLPDVRERFITLALDPGTMPPDQFKAFIAAEVKKWAAVVKAAGIQPE